ncbi:peptide chain release factor N(5)-glutamine methyltransferase [Geobacter sulfurreducens]|jgi:release factor glutamine methyltransferase|uniref:Release factor glutamine methyltransferase n=1 Tax=Geobacter sulfurreducens (strain ATCC 51573 / DSM 12127 / PCA) TaxID=243231 RepID=PRMC_GEOSL|nr:peptide chain release factor N(5)-glutamine methyltransferase [Geobacter sulfurreducens]Q748B2.1 RecName: Full=Release factor glutamine methyltransferase; Short=RF MTase; AltName: Full=N5-glutamine methyltransferase PrmC; AltName: Full=Protein-(glutamine-N5) MTase PrmC; AltName: Full=Protein-glutamine N-methyltransferase PrmC [Geobacter sulfurreducens PCA]AAR36494.1 peptide chain release factor methyltransferase [Geobacter sulfurreducens PCA]ADI85854.1 peptide chain release factor methyltrans
MTEKPEIWTIRKVLDWTRGYLAEKGVENARLETEWLLSAALGLDRVGLYVNFDKPLNPEELAACRGLVARRAKREPLQYILGTQEFCGLDFVVTPSVLIPRHDTEVIVEEALRRAPHAAAVLDIGVGSGCIAVALAKQLPHAQVVGVEQSPGAIALAQRNAERHGARVTLFEGSLFEPLGDQRFDLIVSNPPYIPTADLEALQPEVREYEPRAALDGGSDGLDFYRLIVPAAPEYLNPGGWLMVELGIGQAETVLGMFSRTGFCDCFTAQDPNGIDRVVGGRIG